MVECRHQTKNTKVDTKEIDCLLYESHQPQPQSHQSLTDGLHIDSPRCEVRFFEVVLFDQRQHIIRGQGRNNNKYTVFNQQALNL